MLSSVYFHTVLSRFPFPFYSLHVKAGAVHSSDSSLFRIRWTIGQSNVQAATAKNEGKYTLSNIIYIDFQNSSHFLKFSLIATCS